MPRPVRLRPLLLLVLIAALTAPVLTRPSTTRAQGPSTPALLSCDPAPPATPAPTPPTATPATPAAPPPTDPFEVTIGYVAISIYAPIFVAQEKGYFAEQGLEITLEPFAGGPEPVALTANGDLDAATAGAGPAFWNAVAQGLPLTVVAPGHAEGNPVATPLMISKASCESGAIRSVADLRDKRVAVNARGATEYWLGQALATGGLTLADIELQTLDFQTAVAALESGAIDASMVGEPLATKAEQDGIAVRLATDFPVQDVQPTVIVANSDFVRDNPDAVTGLVTAYLKACRDLSGAGFTDPANLAIIEEYTGVPASLVGAAVQPVYAVDGEIDVDGLNKLQAFFREQNQLEYDDDLDPASFVDTRFVDAALAALGPASE